MRTELDALAVRSEAEPLSAEELAAVKLQNTPSMRPPYKAVWESSGGDGAKVAEAIGLNDVPASDIEYI